MGCAGRWATVGGVAGTGFDAYVRLLHPVHAHGSGADTLDERGVHREVEHTRWPWAEVARRNGRVVHPLVHWSRISDGDRSREWADGWRVDQSDDGWFDPHDLAVLTRHLRTATLTPEDLVVGAGDETSARARRLMHWPGRDMWLFRSSLSELADPTWAHHIVPGWESTRYRQEAPPASMIWPEDHAWVVASEEDWDSTIVAGSRALVDSVLSNDHFEAFEVHEDDGDLLNPGLACCRRVPSSP